MPPDHSPTRSSKGRPLMLRIILTSVVVALALVFALGPFAEAQQPPQPPPTWKQGQPPSMADSPLAPIAQPPAPKAPGEIPVDKINVPPGFKVSLWAHGLNNARVMTWGDKGTLFVSSRVAGNVYAVLPRDLPHGWKYLAFGPDGKLFFNVGAPCYICIPPDTHANISRVNSDGTGFEY